MDKRKDKCEGWKRDVDFWTFAGIDTLQEEACECVPPFECKWSRDLMLRLLQLPRNHPRIKKQIQNVQRQICDITSKLIFCCGSSQQPPVFNEPELVHQIQYDDDDRLYSEGENMWKRAQLQ